MAIFENLFRRLFDIREGEELRALLMFLYSFLVILSLMIVKPVCTALFLSEFGASQLPYVFILVALFAAASSSFYSRLLKQVQLHRLIRGTLKSVIYTLLVLRCLFFLDYLQSWAFYAFYIIVAIFAVMSASQFWILANMVFNAREAKRLFGFIGAGAITGGILGGYATNLLAPILGSENLIFLCAAFLSICIFLVKVIWKENIRHHVNTRFRQQREASKVSDHPFKLIINSRHLTILAGMVGIGVLTARLVEFQFSAIASQRITDEDQLTAFFGFWLSNLNLISLLVQLFFTRRVVGVFGVGTSLFFLPVAILIGALAVLVSPTLWSAILIKMNDGSLKNSINKAGLELLSLPIPTEIKNQAKTFIDVSVDSFASGVSGVVLAVFTAGLGVSVRTISIIIVFVIIGWIYLANMVRKEYIQLFRMRIESSAQESTRPKIDIANESVLGGLIKVLEGDNEAAILQVLRMIRQTQDSRFIHAFQKLIKHASAAVRLEVLRNIYSYKNDDLMSQAEKLISDDDPDVKTEAFHYLFHHWRDNIALFQPYLNHEDYLIRGAALLCIAEESRNNSKLKELFGLNESIEDTLKSLRRITDEEQLCYSKIFCAKAIGAAKLAGLYSYLHILLNDKSPSVLKAAIYAAGNSRNNEFIRPLIQFLANPELLSGARTALTNFGPQIIEPLADHLKRQEIDRQIQLNIPSAIAEIGIQKSVDILMGYLEDSDNVLRYQIMKALNRLRKRFPALNFDGQSIAERILDEGRLYTDILTALYTQRGAEGHLDERLKKSELKETRRQLISALEQKLDFNLERIFRLLGLKYPPDDIYHAYIGINQANDAEFRHNAVEYLDNVLHPSLKKIIIPIVEAASLDTIADETLEQLGVKIPTEFDCLLLLLAGHDNEIKARTLRLIGELGDERYLPFIGSHLNSPDSQVRKMTHFALARMGMLEGNLEGSKKQKELT